MADANQQGGMGDQIGSAGKLKRDWTTEEAYWREQHSRQPYAEKSRPYDEYAAAYRFGFDAVDKYPGEKFDEVEQSLATDWQRSDPVSALPWDSVRPAVRAVWDRMSGVISPRQPDRGVRNFV
jgi:hypothetical protein